MRSKFLEFFVEECTARGIAPESQDDGAAAWRMKFLVTETSGVNVTFELADESGISEAMLGMFMLNLAALFPFILPDVADRFQSAVIAARERLRVHLDEVSP